MTHAKSLLSVGLLAAVACYNSPGKAWLNF